ncbi:primary-amine oxidase [Nonomuraea turcica]|uniref:primary-amine oxidase n=1 Tax=Nonomuraea sp. G32 TaxID=3067274 RepID=UPI00273B5757|nr:primary-amine oxidase [Nonomuraea sp. G32]MDP4503419.1 primary-amine oxidase [Nonomuraea sp. G32]
MTTISNISVRHPLAPLTEEEAAVACRAALASGAVDPGARIAYCALAEPAKRAVLGWDGTPLPREVTVVTYEKKIGRTSMLTIGLPEGALVSCVHAAAGQPPIMLEEWLANAESVRNDPGFQAACAKRGVTDMSAVQIDPWPASNFGLPVDGEGRRLARCVAYVLDGPGDNAYAHPIENLVVVLDRDTGEVVELQDGEVIPVPRAPGRYDSGTRELAPLQIVQPDGPGFTVDDGALRWGPWQLRVSMHPIEGLVLHEICYVEGERVRPVVYRASLSEMIVPYGSTSMNHWWKNAFDAGDVGLGKMANALELGCDCLGEIVYLDAVMVDEDGVPATLRNAICVHEEDHGILWKHFDMMAATSEVRRSRRLVVSFIATVGNYEYGFFWYFFLDGTIQAEVKLTGIIQTQAVAPGSAAPYANLVTPDLAGPHHQHLFNFRLDMCLDGPRNSVYEVEAARVPPGPDNPYGNAFTATSTLLATEAEAQRMAAPEKGRYWKIVNHGSRNAVGEPVAFKLMPTHVGPVLLADDEAAISKRAAFATKHLWVTPFDAEERRAAGDFPNQHPGGAGLPAWTAANRPVVDTDLVLWYTAGTTHFCRPEDFPVMPVEYTGFTLKPAGFFDRNPAIDLAPTRGGHCHP